MRCPKCGYNSFDHLDSCKKCGKDLTEFKQKYGIKSLLFPGQMGVASGVDEVEFDSVADAAVTAATGGAAAVAATATVAEPGVREPSSSGDDDFGFDFMGDSADDDDLSFDELFEEAPENEDIEETIEGPKEAAATEEDGGEFSFDAPDDDLEDDFGFDPAGEAEVEDEFSFDENDSGTEEGPERPFDLPESPQVVGAPVVQQVVEKDAFSAAPVDHRAEAVSATLTPLESVAEVEQHDFAEELPAVAEGGSFEFEPEVVAVEPVEPVSAAASAFADSSPVVAPVKALVPSLAGSVGAFLCDIAIIGIVAISFIVAAEAAMSSQKSHIFPSLETLVDLSIPYFLVIFFLAFGYFTLFHFLVGQTPGKMLAGLRVETVAGEPLAFAQAFLRSVGGLLQLLPAGLGYLLILMHPERRGWNDQLAGTRVVTLRRSS